MKRINIQPRADWENKVKDKGFVFYKDYYNESAAYEFSMSEINQLEIATSEIFAMCLKVVEYVIEDHLSNEFFIPKEYADLIRWSWDNEAISFYGRMDLAYDGTNIKLLEFNADTPTGLLESAVIQWYWLQEYNKDYDQFNSIHEQLLAHMKVCQPYLLPDGKLFFASVNDSEEDYITVKYLQDIAHQANIPNEFLFIEDLCTNENNQFCTADGRLIKNIFKLYPYEWMFREDFGKYLLPAKDQCYWIEPAYKALLSNKILLKYLYKLFPNSPYILPCEYGKPLSDSYVKKPVFSREGANVEICCKGNILESSSGEYGEEGYVYQDYFAIPKFDGLTPVIGTWLIGGIPCGMGIRESGNLITNNTSTFCPHYILNF